MAKAIRRFGRRLKRLFRVRPGFWTRAKPYIVIAILCAFIFIAGGGLYDITERPGALAGYGGAPFFYVPYTLGDQTISESVISMVLLGGGVVGIWLAYEGSKFAYDVKKGSLYTVIGIIVFCICSGMLVYMLLLKLGYVGV